MGRKKTSSTSEDLSASFTLKLPLLNFENLLSHFFSGYISFRFWIYFIHVAVVVIASFRKIRKAHSVANFFHMEIHVALLNRKKKFNDARQNEAYNIIITII